MFNLQGSEIVIILLLALVVLGPEKLPDAMRKAGKFYAELKKMSSGFQNEFRAAVEEPMREVRETANVLRDSADFTKLQSGERDEKPKSAEMAPLAPADPVAAPTGDTPTGDTPTFDIGPDHADGPEVAAESKPAPYADDSSDETPEARSGSTSSVPPSGPSPVPAPPPPFTGMSAPPPADREAVPESHDVGAEPPAGDDSATDESDAAVVSSDDDHA